MSSSSGSTGSTVSTGGCSAATPTGVKSAAGTCREDRLDGAAQGWQRRGGVAPRGFHLLDFADRRGDADPRSRAGPSRRTALNDGKVDRRGRFVAGSMDTRRRGRPAGSTGSTRTSRVTRIDDGIIVLQRPVLEPRRPHLLFRRHLDRRDLGLRLRYRHRRGHQPPHLHQRRHQPGRRRRRLDRRCRRLSVECAGL